MTQDPLVGRLFAGRFRIASLLGTGGMGCVYLAAQEVLDRRVALKLLRPDLLADPKMMRRFEREARAACRLAHPNLTAVYDFGYSEEGVPYLVMEYVEGPTLAEVLARGGPIPVARALPIAIQIAGALEAAHRADVIHRDLKPHNVVLAAQGDRSDVVKILDFGTCKIVGSEGTSCLTTQGTSFGTPQYMAPEQVAGEEVDGRADVYGLGVTLFEMLVGHPPFTGPVMDVLSAQLKQPPPVPSRAAGRPGVSTELDRLVLRCLAKRPEERFTDAAELSRALAAL